MHRLAELEETLMTLLARYRSLKLTHAQLLREKEQWSRERQMLLGEVDRMLAQLDDVPTEES